MISVLPNQTGSVCPCAMPNPKALGFCSEKGSVQVNWQRDRRKCSNLSPWTGAWVGFYKHRIMRMIWLDLAVRWSEGVLSNWILPWGDARAQSYWILNPVMQCPLLNSVYASLPKCLGSCCGCMPGSFGPTQVMWPSVWGSVAAEKQLTILLHKSSTRLA